MPISRSVIEAAIAGFEGQKTEIDAQISELRQMLNGGPGDSAADTPEAPTGKRKKFSAATIKRMREAQQRRWAKIKGEAEPATPILPPAPKPKRKLSAATRAALAANLKKARAAKGAKAKEVSATAPKHKRRFSPEGMKKIVAANKKMWARRRAAAKQA